MLTRSEQKVAGAVGVGIAEGAVATLAKPEEVGGVAAAVLSFLRVTRAHAGVAAICVADADGLTARLARLA
jgi:hypothetical protein